MIIAAKRVHTYSSYSLPTPSQSEASRDEVDDPTTNRQHSDHVNQGAEKKGSEENRQPLKLPGEGRVKESRH